MKNKFPFMGQFMKAKKKLISRKIDFELRSNGERADIKTMNIKMRE